MAMSVPSRKLPEPTRAPLPTVHVAPATGWPAGANPTAAPGLEVNAFATGLDHPRWLHVLPNGDVLVVESNAPEAPGPGAEHSELGHEAPDEQGRGGRAERESRHAPA